MYGRIPNPQKSIQVDENVKKVMLAIEHLPVFTKKYKQQKINHTINNCTYEATEFMSLGVYIDINCRSIDDSRTEVSIEIRRKVGSFNRGSEVTYANVHMENIIDLITESLACDENERQSKYQAQEDERKSKKDLAEAAYEESRQKVEATKKNNPTLYYSRLVLIFGLVFGFLGLMLYALFSM